VAGAGAIHHAPELSPLFGQTLARQVRDVLQCGCGRDVLEIGAGSGALAATLLQELEGLGYPGYERKRWAVAHH
jgi:SAM-dependent MidA family methyltransferase